MLPRSLFTFSPFFLHNPLLFIPYNSSPHLMSYAPLNPLDPFFLSLVIPSTLFTFTSSSLRHITPSSVFLIQRPHSALSHSIFPLLCIMLPACPRLFPCLQTLLSVLFISYHTFFTTSLSLSHAMPSCFPLSFPFFSTQ